MSGEEFAVDAPEFWGEEADPKDRPCQVKFSDSKYTYTPKKKEKKPTKNNIFEFWGEWNGKTERIYYSGKNKTAEKDKPSYDTGGILPWLQWGKGVYFRADIPGLGRKGRGRKVLQSNAR